MMLDMPKRDFVVILRVGKSSDRLNWHIFRRLLALETTLNKGNKDVFNMITTFCMIELYNQQRNNQNLKVQSYNLY